VLLIRNVPRHAFIFVHNQLASLAAGQFADSVGVVRHMQFGGQIFYRASALLAMQTAVIAAADLSVCPSVRHIPVFCQDECGLQCQVGHLF